MGWQFCQPIDTGEASNVDVLQHYVDKFQAFQLSVGASPYRFMINGENTQKLMEVYNYEWTEEEL